MRWAFRALYFRRLLEEAERVITPSRYVGSYFEQFGVDAGRLHLLPYGIPYDAVERLARNPPPSRTRHSLNLAFFGSVVQHKGVHVIIEALATAAMESVNFTVFGPIPSYERQYVQNIRDRAASIRGLKLRMYGSYEPDELGCLYQDIDCIIVPSQWQEAFGLVVLEAFVSGVPVVASRVGGLPELVEEERNGLLFQHDHPEQLAAILRRLAADDLLLQRLQEGARLTPVRTMAEHAEEVRSVYQQAVADFANNGEPKWGAAQELDLIYSTLVDLGASRTDEASAPAP
jgi:glycosyltransferase involved in cell wall biosynthesis